MGALSSCATPVSTPKWGGKLWAGNSASGAIARAQDANPATNSIPAKDPRFDGYVAMSYADFRALLSTYLYSCAQWKAGVTMMDAATAEDEFKVIVDEWQAQVQATPTPAPSVTPEPTPTLPGKSAQP